MMLGVGNREETESSRFDAADLADMPQGGPDACWLDRILQTNRSKYLDRDDIGDDVKRGIVEVSDLNPNSVAAIAASDLSDNPRADIRVIDATAIDAPHMAFGIAVFALSFHHRCWPGALDDFLARKAVNGVASFTWAKRSDTPDTPEHTAMNTARRSGRVWTFSKPC